MARSTKTAHVSVAKKENVQTIIKKFKDNNTIIIVSIKGLPSKQFQDIKKKLRNTGDITVSKKSLLKRSLVESGVTGITDLEPYITENTAVMYTDADAFEVSGMLAREKSPQKAKAGQIAPHDIVVKAGPTQLVPGPDISALSSVGLVPKVEGGKISVLQDKAIVKKGEPINDKVASIMAKLDIIPFEVGIEPVAAFMGGVVYTDIKVDVQMLLSELEKAYGQALPFAVEIAYYTSETLDFILAKAGLHGEALAALTSEAIPVEESGADATEPATEPETKPDESSN